jgi:small subunit ribosomal protein S6
MPLYELGVIIDPEAGPEDEATALERLEKIIAKKKGTIVNKDSWGRRRLAYQIKKKTYGVYHFWKFEVDGQALTDLNFELRTNDTVLRSLTLNLDREMKRQRKTDRLQQAKAAKKAAKAEAAIQAEEDKS